MLRSIPLAVLLVGLAGAAAHAAPSFAELKAQGAQAVLAESDRLTNHYPTQQWKLKMVVKAPGTEERTLELRMWQKDQQKRLVRFDAPGPVKGLSMLSEGKDVMYVYSPQTDNVRRVAAHAQKQTLLGSNMTYSDMSSLDLADQYDAAFAEEEAGFQWLTLTAKKGAEPAWDKLRVRVDEKTKMADTIEYFEDGKVARVQTRTDFGMLDGIPTYRKVTMKTLSDKVETSIIIVEQKIGAPLDDGMFKKKALVRGE
ncbi:MAG: outer membrane lipoprotein-sorting protein [Myxococcales bacterium]|nr:outer membrane lipoprotein-sorting protein [Myxococcales bacterium]MCB9737248.1 outer membrane lipoprotein-sorting protein [Deltaproteobacteria bacterium]